MSGEQKDCTRTALIVFLDENGIQYDEEQHAPVHTMAESEALGSTLVGSRCKNLFVRNKKGTKRFLVITEPDTAVDLGELGRSLGVGRLSFCTVEELKSLLGVEPGAASPFALLADRDAKNVRLLMDVALKPAARFLFHPMVNTATISISREEFLRFLVVIEHHPEYLDIPRRPAEVTSTQ
jgi:Ala-tRNA(Pro) deacylase